MKEFFENDQKYVNIGKIGKLGDHNQIGIFYGANEETIEKIFQSCLNKAQEELKKELDEKSGFLDEMERLIAEKMQEILFRVDLSTACSSTVINDTLQKNIGKLEGEIGKWISAILQEIKSSDDKLATIQAEIRKASTALAENTIVLNEFIALCYCKRVCNYVQLDAIKGCLIGGAIGDALGFSVEFYEDSEIFKKYGEKGITALQLYDGIARFSDDTQMTLFTADGLISASRRYQKPTADEYIQCIYESYLNWLYTQDNTFILGNEIARSDLLQIKELYAQRAPGITCL